MPANQVREMAKIYDEVIINDISQENLDNLKQLLDLTGGRPGNVHIPEASNAAQLGRLEGADIFVVAPDGRWMGDSLARTLNSVVGQGSRAYVATELDTARLTRALRQYGWTKGIAGPYLEGTRIAQGVTMDSFHFRRWTNPAKFRNDVNLVILGR